VLAAKRRADSLLSPAEREESEMRCNGAVGTVVGKGGIEGKEVSGRVAVAADMVLCLDGGG